MKKRSMKRVVIGDTVRPIRRYQSLLPLTIDDTEYTVSNISHLYSVAFDGTKLIELKEHPGMMFYAMHFEIVELREDLFYL